VFFGQSREAPERVRLRLREGPGAPTQLPAAGDEQVAGDVEGVLDGRTIALRNWVTGAPLRTVTLPRPIGTFDVTADGSLAAEASPHGGIYLAPAAGGVRRISKAGWGPEWAGDRIVY
jgi:hypothetical protein